MTKPLFYIRCTTCEARLGIHDKNLVGQIVSCPKCEGMVLVEPPVQTAAGAASAPDVKKDPKGGAEEKSAKKREVNPEMDLLDELSLDMTAPEKAAFSSSVSAGGNGNARAGLPDSPSAVKAGHGPGVSHAPPPPPPSSSAGISQQAGRGHVNLPHIPAHPQAPAPAHVSAQPHTIPAERHAATQFSGTSADGTVGVQASPNGGNADDLDTLLKKRAELSTGELVMRMAGVGVGVFILLLLAGMLLSSLFSKKSQEQTPAEATALETPPLKSPEMAENEQDAPKDAGPSKTADETDDAQDEVELIPWNGPDEEEEEEEDAYADGDENADAEDGGGEFLSDLGRNIHHGGGMEADDAALTGSLLSPADVTEENPFTAGDTPTNAENTQPDAGETPGGAGASEFISRPKNAHYSPSAQRMIHGADTLGTSPENFDDGKTQPGGKNSASRPPTAGAPSPLPPEDSVFISFPEKPSGEHLPAETAKKLSMTVRKLEAADTPLSSVLKFVEQAGGIKIIADWSALQSQGVQPGSPVNLELEEVTLRDILDAATQTHALGYVALGGNLKIVGAEAMQMAQEAAAGDEKMQRLIIPVDDLVSASRLASLQGKAGIQELITLIQTFVAPATWTKNGGLGKITASGSGKIQVEQQYPSVIREIHVFCDKLRLARNIPLRASENKEELAARVQADVDEQLTIISPFIAAQKTCKTPVTCDLSHAPPLSEAVLRVAHAAGAKIVLDENAINAVPVSEVVLDADIPDLDGKLNTARTLLDVPVTYHFSKVPFESAMNILLRHFPMLTCYPVSEDTFVMTTVQQAARTRTLAFIRVDDILSPAAEGSVIQDIRRTIQPDTWVKKTGDGGTGEISYDAVSGRFIIYQNPLVIHEIHQLLNTYRQKKTPGGGGT